MSSQPEVINLLRSLKPFVNQQGVVALETVESMFELLDDPKVQAFNRNVATFKSLMKVQYQAQNKD
ncbi:MAG: hypothetical protein GX262_11995 [Clostridia bacterium]|nr:hypothetical protein [Clostridia bacterium]